MCKEVVIIGTGASLSRYKYQPSDEVWTTVSMEIDEIKPYISKWFGFHPWEKADVDLTNYPLKEIIEKFKSTYFTIRFPI
jgi:hypothetical protein